MHGEGAGWFVCKKLKRSLILPLMHHPVWLAHSRLQANEIKQTAPVAPFKKVSSDELCRPMAFPHHFCAHGEGSLLGTATTAGSLNLQLYLVQIVGDAVCL